MTLHPFQQKIDPLATGEPYDKWFAKHGARWSISELTRVLVRWKAEAEGRKEKKRKKVKSKNKRGAE